MLRAVSRILATMCIALLMWGCPAEENSSQCSNDNDCKGDRICSSGACTDPNGQPDVAGGQDTTTTGGQDTTTTGGQDTTTTGGQDTTTTDPGGYCCVGTEHFTCSAKADADFCNSTGTASFSCARDASQDVGRCGASGKKATGETCEKNDECDGGVCLVRSGGGDIFGYCSNRCESFTDCPTFWDCEDIGNAAGTYCVQN